MPPQGASRSTARSRCSGAGFAARQREQVVVERGQRHLILRPERREELLHRGLQLRHRVGHALADIDGDHELERRSFGREVRDLLRDVVFEQPKVGLGQALDEAAAVGDDGRDLHDLDVDGIGDIEALGADARDRATAADQLGDGANHVLLDVGAGVPRALGARRVHHRAHQPSVGVEHHARDVAHAPRRFNGRPQANRTDEVGVGLGRHDANRRASRGGDWETRVLS